MRIRVFFLISILLLSCKPKKSPFLKKALTSPSNQTESRMLNTLKNTCSDPKAIPLAPGSYYTSYQKIDEHTNNYKFFGEVFLKFENKQEFLLKYGEKSGKKVVTRGTEDLGIWLCEDMHLASYKRGCEVNLENEEFKVYIVDDLMQAQHENNRVMLDHGKDVGCFVSKQNLSTARSPDHNPGISDGEPVYPIVDQSEFLSLNITKEDMDRIFAEETEKVRKENEGHTIHPDIASRLDHVITSRVRARIKSIYQEGKHALAIAYGNALVKYHKTYPVGDMTINGDFLESLRNMKRYSGIGLPPYHSVEEFLDEKRMKEYKTTAYQEAEDLEKDGRFRQALEVYEYLLAHQSDPEFKKSKLFHISSLSQLQVRIRIMKRKLGQNIPLPSNSVEYTPPPLENVHVKWPESKAQEVLGKLKLIYKKLNSIERKFTVQAYGIDYDRRVVEEMKRMNLSREEAVYVDPYSYRADAFPNQGTPDSSLYFYKIYNEIFDNQDKFYREKSHKLDGVAWALSDLLHADPFTYYHGPRAVQPFYFYSELLMTRSGRIAFAQKLRHALAMRSKGYNQAEFRSNSILGWTREQYLLRALETALLYHKEIKAMGSDIFQFLKTKYYSAICEPIARSYVPEILLGKNSDDPVVPRQHLVHGVAGIPESQIRFSQSENGKKYKQNPNLDIDLGWLHDRD